MTKKYSRLLNPNIGKPGSYTIRGKPLDSLEVDRMKRQQLVNRLAVLEAKINVFDIPEETRELLLKKTREKLAEQVNRMMTPKKRTTRLIRGD